MYTYIYTFCNLLLPPSECSKINVQKNVFFWMNKWLTHYTTQRWWWNIVKPTNANGSYTLHSIYTSTFSLHIHILFSCDPHKIMKMCTINKPGRMSSCKMSKMYKDREANVYIPRQNKNLYNFCYIIYHERGKKRF